jgi:hypothetical protein
VDLTLLIAIGSLIWRVRHANATERLQIKWLALAFAVGAGGVVATGLAPNWAAPVIIATCGRHASDHWAAILRYRLYDLDVVINRAVVYGLLTAALAGLYFGFVVVLQDLALKLTGQAQSQLVTVLSTLAIAALFNPLRGASNA